MVIITDRRVKAAIRIEWLAETYDIGRLTMVILYECLFTVKILILKPNPKVMVLGGGAFRSN